MILYRAHFLCLHWHRGLMLVSFNSRSHLSELLLYHCSTIPHVFFVLLPSIGGIDRYMKNRVVYLIKGTWLLSSFICLVYGVLKILLAGSQKAYLCCSFGIYMLFFILSAYTKSSSLVSSFELHVSYFAKYRILQISSVFEFDLKSVSVFMFHLIN